MVAGASRGLGFAVARALAAEGAAVSISSRNQAAIDAAARRIADDTRARTLATPVDVRNAIDLEAWQRRTQESFGGVDLLFVNAGGPPAGTALSFDDAAWTQAFELLLLSAVRMVRLAVPSMRARGGGAIVVSTSSAVIEPIPNLALSNVVRSSVAALSKTLSNELAADKIRVNQLIPGRINTDRVRELDVIRGKATAVSPEAVKAGYEQTIPLGRYGEPEEFAAAAAFLFSDGSRYITGASLQVDGGLIRSV
ncbi:MAG TPA: SDR family oxidoreductase [Vicinamibacterales bacterium]|nr:SDR family oxidoreductase [Vicinamibacterales bacterium]